MRNGARKAGTEWATCCPLRPLFNPVAVVAYLFIVVILPSVFLFTSRKLCRMCVSQWRSDGSAPRAPCTHGHGHGPRRRMTAPVASSYPHDYQPIPTQPSPTQPNQSPTDPFFVLALPVPVVIFFFACLGRFFLLLPLQVARKPPGFGFVYMDDPLDAR